MSEPRHWRRMTRRVFAEHRAAMILLAAVLVVNVLVYAFFVYPLSQRVSTVAERTQASVVAISTIMPLPESVGTASR